MAAIILVNPAHQSADPLVGQLLEDEHFEAEGAFYTMPNMSSIESVQCYAAALDFLANRYNREDNRHGRIHHWIMHNEVDAGNVWTNMGHGRPLHVFLDAYYRSMRLCYNIARNYDEHSEVFASFTHSWAVPVPVDGDYATLDLLNGLLQYSAVEGDFQWGLACHPAHDQKTFCFFDGRLAFMRFHRENFRSPVFHVLRPLNGDNTSAIVVKIDGEDVYKRQPYY